MREKDICLDDIEVIRNLDNTYTVCHESTGEILDKTDERMDLAIKNQKKIDRLNKAKKKGIRKAQGKIDLSETHHLDWKKKSHFIKIYRTEMREYKKQVKLSPNASILLLYLQDYIEYGSNKVLNTNLENFSNSDISNLTGIGVRTIGNALKELEDMLFIKRLGNSHQREIFVNPYLYCSGNIVLKETAKLFDNYKPITPY